MSALTPSELLAQLINSANAAKAKAEQEAEAAKFKAEQEAAEAKKLADALLLADQYEPLHKASADRLVELERASQEQQANAEAESFVIEQVKSNFVTAQALLNSFDDAKKLQEEHLAEKDSLDFLSNFLVEQMKSRGL